MKGLFLLFLSLSLLWFSLEENARITCNELGFEVFKLTYNKNYTFEEEKARYENFLSICQTIASHNAEHSESTYSMAINGFADEYSSENSRKFPKI
jgi:hypothetical protein